MVLYSLILLLTAVPVGFISLAIYRGKTELIHDYHQANVTNKAAYGKAFGKALFVVAAALLLSGVIGLCGQSDIVAKIAVAVLFIGLAIGIACILVVQKKYNNGLF